MGLIRTIFIVVLSFYTCLAAIPLLNGVNWSPGVIPKSQKRGLTQNQKDFLLGMHNLYRKEVAKGKFGLFGNKPNAANMELMEWDDDAATYAQKWADNCGGPPHGNHPDQGQNYAAAGGSLRLARIIQSAFQGWNDGEDSCWNWTKNNNRGTEGYNSGAGHFSQNIWATTNKVGCGFNACGSDKNLVRLVCNFKPAGNWQGANAYKVGKPCSSCPSTAPHCVYGALCSKTKEPPAASMVAGEAVTKKISAVTECINTCEKCETPKGNGECYKSDFIRKMACRVECGDCEPPPRPKYRAKTLITIKGKFTQAYAQKLCKKYGGILAVIENDGEQDLAVQLLKKTNTDNCNERSNHCLAFIGLKRVDGKFKYPGVSSDYRKWHVGQPDNKNNKEDCVELKYFGSGGEWNDVSCDEKRSLVCQKYDSE